jgi:hypothetical protein
LNAISKQREEDQYERLGKHIHNAAISTGGDFAEHYSKAFDTFKQIRRGFEKNSVSPEMIQTHLSPVAECLTDLSRAALIHLNGTEAASKLEDNDLHAYWVDCQKSRGKSFRFPFILTLLLQPTLMTCSHPQK